MRSFDAAFQSQVHERGTPEYVSHLEHQVQELQQQLADFQRRCTCHQTPHGDSVVSAELSRRPSVDQEVLQEDNARKAAQVVDDFFKNIKVSQSRGTITANDQRYILCKPLPSPVLLTFTQRFDRMPPAHPHFPCVIHPFL